MNELQTEEFRTEEFQAEEFQTEELQKQARELLKAQQVPFLEAKS